jgi:acetylornithine aminotransferase
MNAPEKLPLAEPHVMKTYGRLPIAPVARRGCWLWDTEGKKYLDALPGIAVNTLGHGHPSWCRAARPDRQADPQLELLPRAAPGAARRQAVRALGLTNVFFCNSGLEANEAALKIARKYGHDKGIERPEIVVYEAASTAARSPRSRRPATPRSRPASGRSSRASSASAQRRRGDRGGRARDRTSSPSSSR